MTVNPERESDLETAGLVRTVVDKIPAMVAYWDKSQVCRFANRAYEKWFGVPPEAVVGKSMKELLGSLYALNLPHIENALRGEEQEFEREIPDPAQGPPRHSQAHYIPHVVDGEVQGLCVLVTDITRRKRAEEALQAAQCELESRERLVAMATLAGGIAHEINNPLAAVLGNVDLALDMLDEGTVDTVDLRDMLRDVQSAATRVRDIVRSMKLLARGDTVQRERVDIADCVEQSIAFAANTLRYRSRLIRQIAPELHVEANVAQLSQVFVNLLAHAANALPEETPARNEIRIMARRDGDQILIEIADNGRGVPEQLQSRIFEPFFAMGSTTGGIGLGLSVSRSIVEGLGGTITCNSQGGRGNVFRLRLPVAEALAPRTDAPPSSERRQPVAIVPSAVRSKVLIVDDEEAIAALVARALIHEACEVTRVNRGLGALTALDGQSFDLILCDLMMPGLSGEDLYREAVRRWPELARRFVFLTGGAFTPRGRQFLAKVPAPVLEKPFQIAELVRLVKACLQPTREAVRSCAQEARLG
jgi:PAS domain S-box-containing protein